MSSTRRPRRALPRALGCLVAALRLAVCGSLYEVAIGRSLIRFTLCGAAAVGRWRRLGSVLIAEKKDKTGNGRWDVPVRRGAAGLLAAWLLHFHADGLCGRTALLACWPAGCLAAAVLR